MLEVFKSLDHVVFKNFEGFIGDFIDTLRYEEDERERKITCEDGFQRIQG